MAEINAIIAEDIAIGGVISTVSSYDIYLGPGNEAYPFYLKAGAARTRRIGRHLVVEVSRTLSRCEDAASFRNRRNPEEQYVGEAVFDDNPAGKEKAKDLIYRRAVSIAKDLERQIGCEIIEDTVAARRESRMPLA